MRNQPLIFLHLRLVAKISLGVGAVAVLSLLLSLLLISGDAGDSYAEIIRTNSITRAHLDKVMLMTGLVLIALAGVITWGITLYSSFRIAGPLYRFSQNLKLASASDFARLIDLRNDDSLVEQAKSIKQAVDALREHHVALEQASQAALNALQKNDAAAYAEALARLKLLDEKACV